METAANLSEDDLALLIDAIEIALYLADRRGISFGPRELAQLLLRALAESHRDPADIAYWALAARSRHTLN